jgi:hypothetical protein
MRGPPRTTPKPTPAAAKRRARRVGTITLPASIRSNLLGAGLSPDAFQQVQSAFGDLPANGTQDLCDLLVAAIAVYRARCAARQRPRAAQEKKRLEDISRVAERLLNLLGVEQVNSDTGELLRQSLALPSVGSRLLIELQRVAVERRPVTATFGADDRLAFLLASLSDLSEAAAQSVRAVAVPGWGGRRRSGPEPLGQLIEDSIEAYTRLRKGFPKSGPQPAYGGPLVRFVRASVKLAVVSVPGPSGMRHDPWYASALDPSLPDRITDAAIRGSFNRWRNRARRS